MHNQPDFRTNLCFEALWDTKQWFEPAFVQLNSEGCILSISEESKTQESTERIRGFVIPGHNNAHSHAFQYALAGLAEHLPNHSAADDFGVGERQCINLQILFCQKRWRTLH